MSFGIQLLKFSDIQVMVMLSVIGDWTCFRVLRTLHLIQGGISFRPIPLVKRCGCAAMSRCAVSPVPAARNKTVLESRKFEI